MENKSEENLQGVIEKSYYWDKQKGSGEYILNKSGKSKIHSLFRYNPDPVRRIPLVKLWRYFHGKKYSIEINSTRKRLFPYMDEMPMSGVSVRKYLDSHGAYFKVKSSTATTKFWNWIIQDNDYYWER